MAVVPALVLALTAVGAAWEGLEVAGALALAIWEELDVVAGWQGGSQTES